MISAIRPLHHAVGLQCTRLDQAMFDTEFTAAPVKNVVAAGRLVFAGKAIRELAAVVSEQFGDGHRTGLLDSGQEVGGAVVGLIGVDVHVYPAGGSVDGDKQVTPRRFIRHLRQVLDIEVQETRLILLEALGGFLLCLITRHQVAQLGHPMAAQATSQAGA